MAIEFNVDSQVRPYATLSAFPVTGSVKTLYIDESTSDLYYWDGSAYAIVKSQSKYEAIDAINGTGATVLKMSVCYLKTSSSSANTPELLLSNASTEATSSKTIGLLLQDLANGATGKIITSGEYDKFDTSAYNVGDRLWLSTIDGQVTTTIPSAPIHAVFIGFVTRKQSQNGRILVSIQNGYELREIHDVSLPTTPLDGQVLAYDSPTSLWKAKTISTGITIGTTAITSGTVGRVLFEGAGNVVSESANLFWDNTNGRLGIGTSSPTQALNVSGFSVLTTSKTTATPILAVTNTTSSSPNSNNFDCFAPNMPNASVLGVFYGGKNILSRNNFGFNWNHVSDGSTGNSVSWEMVNVPNIIRAWATGNVGLNTGTDAGYKLDVNGTARLNTLTIGLGGGQVSSNTALGFQALNANTTAIANTMVGYQAGLSITTSQEMTGIGFLALRSNASASTAIGSQAMSNSTSAQSVAVGANALYSGTGISNTAIGQRSLIATTSGTGNTAIGRQSGGANTTGGNNIFIGNGTDGVSATESNRTWIGNSSTTTSWLGGSLLIGTTTDVASSIATFNSTTKGFLPPRMDTTQKNAIASPATGLMVYDTTLNLISVYNGTIWISL